MKHTTVTAAKESSRKKYEEKRERALKLLKHIERALKNADQEAREKNNIHWGHVGSMSHIERQLQDIEHMLTNTGEYAS